MNLSPFFKKEVAGLLLGGRETNPYGRVDVLLPST